MDIVNNNYAVSILAIYTPNLSWNYDGRIYEIIIKIMILSYCLSYCHNETRLTVQLAN
jgi:hypothetical protein